MLAAATQRPYLSHEQKIIDEISDQVTKVITKTYLKSISCAVPIIDFENQQYTWSDDVFVKASANKYFPTIYYKYGTLLAPMSMLTHVALHNYISLHA